MRIIIITQSFAMFEKIQAHLQGDITGVIEPAPRGYCNKNSVKIHYITNLFISKLKQQLTLRTLSNKKRIPYFFINKKCDTKLRNWIRQQMPDLIIVFSMPYLLPEEIFSIPKNGTINIHPAYLPKWRGPNPYFWMYYYCDLEFGITIHYIDNGEDTGDILIQKKIEIKPGTKLNALQQLLIDEGSVLLFDTVDKIKKGILNPIRQQTVSPTVRARNVKVKEESQLIKYNEWELERIWHFLCGTEGRPFILPRKHLAIGMRWKIGMYRHSEVSDKKIGNIEKVKRNYILYCKDGSIVVNKKLSISWLLYDLINFFFPNNSK